MSIYACEETQTEMLEKHKRPNLYFSQQQEWQGDFSVRIQMT